MAIKIQTKKFVFQEEKIYFFLLNALIFLLLFSFVFISLNQFSLNQISFAIKNPLEA